MFQYYSIVTNQTISFLFLIDVKPIVEYGESPAAITLSIAILISILVSSITKLVQVIMMTRSVR
jgi:hypothetical protein